MENHQTAVATGSAAIATKTVPPTRSSHGCVHAPAKITPSAAASQTTGTERSTTAAQRRQQASIDYVRGLETTHQVGVQPAVNAA
jgi:hypothetical protein